MTADFMTKMFSIMPRRIIYCDVGARGGVTAPWSSFSPMVEVVAFEPDEVEYRYLSKIKEGRIFNYALYRASQKIALNLTKDRGCSSIYKPNMDFLSEFPEADRYIVEDSVTVKAISLDEMFQKAKLRDIDFIKIDVQGAELDVLKGGQRFLKEYILGMEIEVEFHPIYQNQPLFNEVDLFIRDELELDLQDLKKYYWKLPQGVGYGSAKGKLIFGEALYFRSPENVLKLCEKISKKEAKEKLIMAVFMGSVYGYFDYALSLINKYRKRGVIEEAKLSQMEKLIRSYGKGFRYTGKFSSQLAELFRLLYRMFQPTHKGWGSIGQPLGVRKKFGTFF